MKHTNKITRRNEWRNFNSVLILLTVSLIAGPAIFYYRDPMGDFWDFFPFLVVTFLLFFIPLIVIHMRYYYINEGMEMEYDDMTKNIIIKDTKKDTVSEFNLDDIKRVFHTMSMPMAERRMHWFPWDSYNYSDILLKNGKTYRITSLMVYRLELPVGDKYDIITSFYSYPRS